MKKLLVICSLFIFGLNLSAQNAVQFSYNGDSSYSLVERTDLRRYDNNRYVGLVQREVRSFIMIAEPPRKALSGNTYYDGSFYVQEDTVRASRAVDYGFHNSIPASFRITNDGQLFMIEDHGFPSFRSFPAFTQNRIKPGDRWQAKAERAIDPLYKGIVTKIPMYVEYTYLRDENFKGEDVYVVGAKWATRYGQTYWDFGGDKELKSASGAHNATMYISKETGNAIVVRDTIDETFVYSDGNQYTFRGTISLFTEYPPAVDRSKVLPALQKALGLSAEEIQSFKEKPKLAMAEKSNSSAENFSETENANHSEEKQSLSADKSESTSTPSEKTPKSSNADSNSEDASTSNASTKNLDSATENEAPKAIVTGNADKPIIVENTQAGIRLTMQNLQFKPDSADLVPGEENRLDQIAQILLATTGCQFLVEGHTAATGNPNGEQRLSELRAQTVAKEMIKRGISTDRFITKGSGGRKPVADNSTAAGKAKNRRVEITILE